MKNLLASVSYSFSNFYENLNEQGKMVFLIIVFLIILLFIILIITYAIDSVRSRIVIKHIKNKENVSLDNTNIVNNKASTLEKENTYEEKTEIMDIAENIEKAIKESTPITLTNFEEDQERTAIISIDELMARAKDLDIASDEEYTGVNYLEKYNLEPAEVEQMVKQTTSNNDNSGEVKAFKVSQVISPVYGIKKEVINKGE